LVLGDAFSVLGDAFCHGRRSASSPLPEPIVDGASTPGGAVEKGFPLAVRRATMRARHSRAVWRMVFR
jgi:hypothetical protein